MSNGSAHPPWSAGPFLALDLCPRRACYRISRPLISRPLMSVSAQRQHGALRLAGTAHAQSTDIRTSRWTRRPTCGSLSCCSGTGQSALQTATHGNIVLRPATQSSAWRIKCRHAAHAAACYAVCASPAHATCHVPRATAALTGPVAWHYHRRLGHVVRDRPRRQHSLRRAAAVAAPLAGAGRRRRVFGPRLALGGRRRGDGAAGEQQRRRHGRSGTGGHRPWKARAPASVNVEDLLAPKAHNSEGRARICALHVKNF